MIEKIFDEKPTIEELDKKINQYMESKISNIKDKNVLEKWNYFSVINLEDNENKQKLLEVSNYIDQVIEDIDKKISEILTLVYITVKEKVNIKKIDNNSLFLVINYLEKMDLKLMKEYIPFLLNENLLYKIRLKTLDIEVRVKLLDYLVKNFRTPKEMLDFIENTEYYDMLEIIS